MKSKLEKERLPFFVYGTLVPGQPNAYLWEDSVMQVEVASLTGGCLYDMGSYPMLVEEADGQVVGIVNHVAENEYETVLARLDYLEGFNPAQPSEAGYRRVVRDVQVEKATAEHGQSGRSLRVWVYIGHPTLVRGLRPIPGGDWAAYAAATFQDIEQWWRDVESAHHLPDD